MADEVDIAQQAEEQFRRLALAAIARIAPPAEAADCRECGEEIPLPRRLAIRTDLCAHCADFIERVIRKRGGGFS